MLHNNFCCPLWKLWPAKSISVLEGFLVKYGEERSIVCHCTYEEKTIFLGFSQNGCYGNQPHPFEAYNLKALIPLTSAVPAL